MPPKWSPIFKSAFGSCLNLCICFLQQAFKNLTKLTLLEIDCSPDKISSLGSLRGTLKYLEAHKCGLTAPRNFLMCDSKDCDVDDPLGVVALSQVSVDERPTSQHPAAKEVITDDNIYPRVIKIR